MRELCELTRLWQYYWSSKAWKTMHLASKEKSCGVHPCTGMPGLGANCSVSQGHLWLRELLAQVSSGLWPSQQHRVCGWPSPPSMSCNQVLCSLEEAPHPLITTHAVTTTPFLFLQNPAAGVCQLANTCGWLPSSVGKRRHSWLLAVGAFLSESAIGCLQPFL